MLLQKSVGLKLLTSIHMNVFFAFYFTIIAVFCFVFAWNKAFQNQFNSALVLLMLAALILRFVCASDLFLHQWDERFHALVAKNILINPIKPTLYAETPLNYDYRNWTANYVWLHKQPLPLYTMAASMFVFGVNEFALRLPSVLLSTLLVYLVFYIGRYFYTARVGFIAAFLASIHGLIIELSAGRVTTDHIDVFFLFFITLGMYFSVRFVETNQNRFLPLVALSTALAILSKWLPALIVLPFLAVLMLYSKRFSWVNLAIKLALVLGLIALFVFPWQVYIHFQFPLEAKWEQEYNLRHFWEVIEGHTGPFYYHINKIRMLFGDLVYIPLAWFAFKSLKKWRTRKSNALLIWFLLPFVFFSIATSKMQGYTLPTAPVIFIATALFVDFIWRFRNRMKYRTFTLIVLSLFLLLPIRFSFERMKLHKGMANEHPNAIISKSLKRQLPEKSIVFGVEDPISFMFYTKAIAYDFEIPNSMKESLIDDGYQLFNLEGDTLVAM